MSKILVLKYCEYLKTNPSTSHIPVIFVTAMGDIDDEAKGFDVGGVDYIQKPISGPIMLRRVQTHLSLVRAKDLEKSQKAAIYMLGEAGHYNDTDTGDHIWRMASYARELALAAGYSAEFSDLIELAAPMHDTGKIGIPDKILKAPRKLSTDEWKIMKTHSTIGFNILSMSDTPVFKIAAEIAHYHHEKWDGSGYPDGLKEEEIPDSARIVAIVDVFDALTIKRPYKEAWSIEQAIAELQKGRGAHFDPHLTDIFIEKHTEILSSTKKWK